MNARTVVLAFASSLLAAACAERAGTPQQPSADLNVADLLGGSAADSAGFARAMAPPDLVFPRDHGAHSAFRTEWWYVTANLAADGGRRFGVQLVFFRQALAPPAAGAARSASLAAREVILAHAAVTDVGGKRFFAGERLARSAAGLAAARGGASKDEPFAVHCADWSVTASADGDGLLPLELRASDGQFAFTLVVGPGKPLVLQGESGLSQKSDEPGNASIYYSMTRLPIAGRLVVGGEGHEVRGDAWLDREWSTSALGPDQVGWDWFSLQLDDGSEVMWYQLRRRDGGVDPWSRGCLVARDGAVTTLSAAAVTATPDGEWRAPDGGARYPARWRLRGSSPAFDLEVEPLLPDQELRMLVRYWEGAVAVRGTRDGAAVTGRGYLEMTGYAGVR